MQEYWVNFAKSCGIPMVQDFQNGLNTNQIQRALWNLTTVLN